MPEEEDFDLIPDVLELVEKMSRILSGKTDPHLDDDDEDIGGGSGEGTEKKAKKFKGRPISGKTALLALGLKVRLSHLHNQIE